MPAPHELPQYTTRHGKSFSSARSHIRFQHNEELYSPTHYSTRWDWTSLLLEALAESNIQVRKRPSRYIRDRQQSNRANTFNRFRESKRRNQRFSSRPNDDLELYADPNKGATETGGTWLIQYLESPQRDWPVRRGPVQRPVCDSVYAMGGETREISYHQDAVITWPGTRRPTPRRRLHTPIRCIDGRVSKSRKRQRRTTPR